MEVPRRSNEAFLRMLVRELLAQRGAAVCAIASALLDNFIVVRRSLPVKTPITRREVTNSSAVGGLWRSRQVGIKRDSVRVSDLEMRIAAPLIRQVTQNGDTDPPVRECRDPESFSYRALRSPPSTSTSRSSSGNTVVVAMVTKCRPCGGGCFRRRARSCVMAGSCFERFRLTASLEFGFSRCILFVHKVSNCCRQCTDQALVLPALPHGGHEEVSFMP
jgi:hypothetical protein